MWVVLYYLRFFAKIALIYHRPYIIGVAGSVGKSSTRNALFAAYRDTLKIGVISGNSETGIPLGLLGIELLGYDKKSWLKTLLKCPIKIRNLRKYDYLIVEMGIDDPYPPKNMSYLLTIVKPDLAIDLNATATHTMQFEKLLPHNVKNLTKFLIKKIAEEDSKIITNGYTKVGIYNCSDPNLSQIIPRNSRNVTLIPFGLDKGALIRLTNYVITSKKTVFTYSVPSKRGAVEHSIVLRNYLLPKNSYESFASVLACSYALKIPYSVAIEGIESNFKPPKGRATVFEGVRQSTIIDSSYNASKSTVLSFLQMAKDLKNTSKRPIVFVMGDMRELGAEAKLEHEEVAYKACEIVDELHCVGELTSQFVVPIAKEVFSKSRKKKVEWYKNSIQAGLYLKENLPLGSIVVVKGSQNTIFLEEAIKFLLKNPSDSKNLTRQEEYWMEVKRRFFNI
ncbi:MAG TPA: Mur ligase family protein [Candidatus Nitrosotenuis sp.]|nr:Mur ligase family protein [Candidatus Nitrosotenuis sp.]